MSDYEYAPLEQMKQSISEDYWETQAGQFPLTGDPGITLQQVRVGSPGRESSVDCLLYRSADGELTGALFHYHADHPMQREHSLNILVEPGHQRQGIATSLLWEAVHRWPVLMELGTRGQDWTPESMNWMDRMVEKGIFKEDRTGFVEEYK